jgi:D-threo-aldose 1-dehydrogenase
LDFWHNLIEDWLGLGLPTTMNFQMNNPLAQPIRGILPPDMIPLGFGCGSLLCGLSRRESRRLLETAIDCGITHFDTARMYGFGGAEGLLGELTPRYRDRITITSKAGILPASRSIFLRLVNRGTLLLHRAAPKLKDYVSTPARLLPRLGVFELPALRKSIDTSLKELRTDYLDIFLLHECSIADAERPYLLDFLETLRKQGKIRQFGLATGIEETIFIAKTRPLLTPVIQIPNSAWDMNITRLPARPSSINITHSILTSRFHGLLSRLASDDSLAREWKSMTHSDPHDPTALAQLFLAHALHSNRGGVVLFFSSKPANIKANVKIVKEATVDLTQIEGLRVLLGSTSE